MNYQTRKRQKGHNTVANVRIGLDSAPYVSFTTTFNRMIWESFTFPAGRVNSSDVGIPEI